MKANAVTVFLVVASIALSSLGTWLAMQERGKRAYLNGYNEAADIYRDKFDKAIETMKKGMTAQYEESKKYDYIWGFENGFEFGEYLYKDTAELSKPYKDFMEWTFEHDEKNVGRWRIKQILEEMGGEDDAETRRHGTP